MIGGATLVSLCLMGSGALALKTGMTWEALLVVWGLLGAGFSCVMTPAGRLVRQSGAAEDLPRLFGAQFALSHLCWLVTYPLAGFLGIVLGLPLTLLVLGTLGWIGVGAALSLWAEKE